MITKSLKIIVLVVFMIGIGLLGYFLWLKIKYRPLNSRSTADQPETLEDVMLVQIYNYKNFDESVIFHSPSDSYSITGIADGVAIEEPFEIKTTSGELIATNELSYRIFYLDEEKKLESITAALVVRLPDNSIFPLGEGDLIKEEFGEDVTLEEMKSFFKRHFENMPGRVVSTGFWTSTEDIDKFIALVRSKGYSIEPGSYQERRLQLGKKHIEGRENEYKNLVETGDSSLGVILLNDGTSDFFGKNPKLLDLRNASLLKLRNSIKR
jgi:hypothetical protein